MSIRLDTLPALDRWTDSVRLSVRLRNDLYCDEWDVKLYCTISYRPDTVSQLFGSPAVASYDHTIFVPYTTFQTSKGNPPQRGIHLLGEKTLQVSPFITEMVRDNGNSQVVDLSLLVSVMLSDLESRNAKGQTSQLRTNRFT